LSEGLRILIFCFFTALYLGNESVVGGWGPFPQG